MTSTKIATQTVLQVIPALDAGGAERTTVEIARVLVAGGFGSLVATAGGRLAPRLTQTGTEILRLPVDSKAPQTLVANALRLARLVRNRNIRLIHARSRAPAWSALAAARATGIPFVTTYHGAYNASNPLKRLYNSIMARGDVIIANSLWTAERIANEHGIARDRIAVIPRGVDLMEFDPAGIAPDRIEKLRNAWGAADGDLVILLPGRLTRWKGQLVLIEALAQLARAGQLGGVRAVMAGDAQGRDSYAAELKTAIAKAGLGDTIRISGHVADMPAAYLASDIVVSASTDPEAFGRVAAEAAAMGRPVVATDHGGARETVLKGVSGLLIPPGDATAFAGALKRLIETGEEGRRCMGKAGRSHVRANFSVETMCAATLAVYRSLLSG